MATVRVEEAYAERDETIDAKGNVIEVEIPYLVFGVSDESAALAAARPKVKTITGMSLDSIEVMERINGDTWKVKAVYGVDEDGETPDDTGEEEDTTVFAFDTGVTAPCGWLRPMGKQPSRAQASAERHEAPQPVDQDRRTLSEHGSRLRGGYRGGQRGEREHATRRRRRVAAQFATRTSARAANAAKWPQGAARGRQEHQFSKRRKRI